MFNVYPNVLGVPSPVKSHSITPEEAQPQDPGGKPPTDFFSKYFKPPLFKSKVDDVIATGVWKFCDSPLFNPKTPLNPAMKALSHEAEFYKPEKVDQAAKELSTILEKADQKLAIKELIGPVSPIAKLATIYEVLGERGYSYEPMDYLTTGLLTHKLDCDTVSYIVLSWAQRHRWPVHAVLAPGHMFVRWDEGSGGIGFNMDIGGSKNRLGWSKHSNDYYKHIMGISEGQIKAGIYLKSLSVDELTGSLLTLRGMNKKDHKQYDSALANLNEALRLNPKDPFALYHRAHISFSIKGDSQSALRDLNICIDANPEDVVALRLRASIFIHKKDDKRALQDLDTLMHNSWRVEKEYRLKFILSVGCECARISFDNGEYANAKSRYDDLIKVLIREISYLSISDEKDLSPIEVDERKKQMAYASYALSIAHYNRAAIREKLKDEPGMKNDSEIALSHTDQFLKFFPKDVDCLGRRGIILFDLGKYSEAYAAFKVVLKIDPKNEEALAYLRKPEMAPFVKG